MFFNQAKRWPKITVAGMWVIIIVILVATPAFAGDRSTMPLYNHQADPNEDISCCDCGAISGTLYYNGTPQPNAIIWLKEMSGTNYLTETDLQGEYLLDIPDGVYYFTKIKIGRITTYLERENISIEIYCSSVIEKVDIEKFGETGGHIRPRLYFR